MKKSERFAIYLATTQQALKRNNLSQTTAADRAVPGQALPNSTQVASTSVPVPRILTGSYLPNTPQMS